MNWGNSSSRNIRSHFPTRVMRSPLPRDPLGPFPCDLVHGAKLDDIEAFTVQTHPRVDEEHRAAGIQLDCQYDRAEEQGEDDQAWE